MKRKDYSPIVASFLHQMIKGGWKIARVIDCADQSHELIDKSDAEAKKIAKSEILADDSNVVFQPNGKARTEDRRFDCLKRP